MTWDGFAGPVLTTWCSPCHASTVPEEERRGAPVGIDFDSWEGASAYAEEIADAVVSDPPRMPPAGGLSDEEREQLVRWVSCGAPGTPSAVDPCAERIAFEGDATSAGEPCTAGANTVTGDLVIGGDPGDALGCVCEVEGDVLVTGQAREVSLDRLQRVGGMVRADAVGLTTLALPSLAEAGAVWLEATPLTVLAIDELTTVGGAFRAAGGRLPPTFGPQRLQTVGSGFVLEDVGGTVTIDLPRLESVGGDLIVDRMADLEALVHTSDLLAIGGSLRLIGNPRFVATEDFGYLATVGGDLEIGGGGVQTGIDAFWNLESIGGDLILRDEPALATLLAFLRLSTVGGTVTLSGLGLHDVEGFEQLEHVGGVRVVANPVLTRWKGGHTPEVLGHVTITSNPALRELPLVVGTSRIDGTVTVSDMPGLVSMRDLGDLPTLGGSLVLARNESLVDVGFPQLVGIGGDLTIEDNVAFATLQGFVVLRNVLGDTVLRGNVALPQAEIDQFLFRVEVAGSTTVEGNGL